MANLGLLDKKNKGFKNLSLLPGFNLADPPVKINDNLHINNKVTLDNGNVIDEKIFIKFFEVVDNTNASTKEKKQTRKKRKEKKETKKETKKLKN